MNKIKLLIFHSVYLIILQPLTVIHTTYIKSVGKRADILPALLFLKITFKKLSTLCPSVRRYKSPQADELTFIKYIILELQREIGSFLSIVKIDPNNGRFTRRSLPITGSIGRSSACSPAYSTNEEDLHLNQIQK